MGSWVCQELKDVDIRIDPKNGIACMVSIPKEGMSAWEKRLERIDPDDRDGWQIVIGSRMNRKLDYELNTEFFFQRRWRDLCSAETPFRMFWVLL